VEEIRTNLNEIFNHINTLDIELNDNLRENNKISGEIDLEIMKSALDILKHQNEVATILEDIQMNCFITSPFKGRVVEVRTKKGNILQPGQTILMLENTDYKKVAIFFLDTMEGKKVKPGMTSRVYPSTVKHEEFGGIMGIVTKVSPYSISSDALVELIGNKDMAEKLIQDLKGPPIVAVVDLIPAGDTFSGYRWTSSEGPELEIKTGTFFTGDIMISKRRPLSLVMPVIKHILGI